jgi:SAM-dependent methyltransferase
MRTAPKGPGAILELLGRSAHRMPDPAHDFAVNRDLWTAVNAEFTDADALRAWSAQDVTWGLFKSPERDLGALGNVADLNVIELGCGTGYFSAWLARLGARPVGIDVTRAQLETARRCQEQFSLTFPLIEADAQNVPLADGIFDLAVSEYGASVWCDPERWVPEAARILRPGGRLVFLTNSVLASMCVPEQGGYATDRLLRPQKAISRVHWPGGGIEFHPSHGAWIRILRESGFLVEAVHELYAPVDAKTPEYYDIATADWARQWPIEDLWTARLLGSAEDRASLVRS